MSITNVSRSVNLSTSGIFLPHPAGKGIDEGYYVIYSASSESNLLTNGAGYIKGYQWGSELPTATAGNWLQILGTVQIVSESISGSTTAPEAKYHGSNIIHIGPGVNDITAQREDNALFFAHMGQYGGTVQTNDEFFYWDRLYLEQNQSSWEYYNYHAHNPSSYAQFNNGRQTFGSDDRSGLAGSEQYAHIIQTRVSVMGTAYQTVLARVHTPSVGGAHNSHNDVELGSVSSKNYMMGGIINGTSDRFHAFYIAPNGSDWDVFSRTFIYSNATFNAEINHGTYDLADPNFGPTSTPASQSRYPVRVSAGKLFNSNIYFPVLYRSGSTAFDVKIWEFTSAANLSINPIVTNLITGSIIRPDCHLADANNELYAAVSDINDGGISLYKLSGSVWVDQGQIVTNNNGKYLRVHGLEFNAAEVKFYVMISGDASGSGTTYLGSGVYSFTPDIPFDGYKHVDYISGSNSFILRDALEAGYVQYDSTTYTLKRSGSTEPQAIDITRPVLNYEPNSPQFYEKKQITLGGNEGFNHAIELKDGRQLFAGTRGEVDTDFNISYVKGLLTLYYPGDTSPTEHYTVGGRFDDYITGIIQSSGSGLIYFVGFTKNLLVDRRDLMLHGIGRGLLNEPNYLEFVDLTLDESGSQYIVGNHIESSSIILANYDYNFDLKWQKEISAGTLNDTAHGIARDSSGNIYIAGKTNNSGSGNDDALVLKLNNSGSLTWARMYGTSGSQYASSVAVVASGSTEYVVVPIVSASTTTITALDTNGNILEQNRYSNLVVNRLRDHETTSDGRFTFAGHNNASPTVATFGVGAVNNGATMLNWVRTHTSASANTQAYDMRNTGDALEYMVVGTEGNDAYAMKLLDKSGTISRSWVSTTSGSTFTALANTPSTIVSQSRFTYVVGWTSASQNPQQASANGVITRFDHTGSRNWFNTLGHTSPESLNAIEMDVLKQNVITIGKSRSHTDGQRTLLFRAEKNGFGTANHHLEGSPGMAMWYLSGSGLSPTTGLGSLNTISTPTNVTGDMLTSSSTTFVVTGSFFTSEVYEGSTVFDGFMGILNIGDIQSFKNTSNYTAGSLNDITHLVDFHQVAVAGDGQADDGNIFLYDVIELTSGSNAGRIAIAGQSSGDLTITNTGNTGVYDYLILFYTPSTDSFVIWQNGTELDEEIYSLTELDDGDVAFVGRTDGLLGTDLTTASGYNIFTGIINPTTLEVDYYTTGSGQADRGVKIHDISKITGNPEFIVVYETSGEVGTATNSGPDDIGVITFNYVTDTWGPAYQVGSTQSEFLDTLGHVSALIPDGRLAIVGASPGAFGDTGDTFGQADLFLAIFDIPTNTWKKYQVGTGATDIGRTVEIISGNKLLIGGTTAASFSEPNDAISVLFDIGQGLKAKLS